LGKVLVTGGCGFIGSALVDVLLRGTHEVDVVDDLSHGHVLETIKAAAPHPVDIVSIPERRRANDRPFLCPDVTRLTRLKGAPAKPFSAAAASPIFAEKPIKGALQ